MNQNRFQNVMNSIDNSLLEEAMQPHNFFIRRLRYVCSIAACFCILVCGMFLLHTQNRNGNPTTVRDITEAGYQLPVPEKAGNISYALLEFADMPETPMAQAIFTIDNTEYTIRTLHTTEATDISGLTTSSQEEPLVWSCGPLELKLCSADDSFLWLSWYSRESGTQYCLSAREDSLTLLQTARDIVETLGYSMAVAPENASEITYQAFPLQNLTVAETSFLCEGIRYSYRTASTSEVSMMFADISGTTEEAYAVHTSTELGWCPAELYYNEGETGKIIWFDIVPGLLYSLTMDTMASEETLLSMAEALFEPVQGDD